LAIAGLGGLNGGISIVGRPPTERNAQMFNGALAKILEAQKITIRLLANFANSFDALDTQGSIHPAFYLRAASPMPGRPVRFQRPRNALSR